MQLTPVTKKLKGNDLERVYFDITLLVNKNNELRIVDNQKEDWKEIVDCDTVYAQSVELEM